MQVVVGVAQAGLDGDAQGGGLPVQLPQHREGVACDTDGLTRLGARSPMPRAFRRRRCPGRARTRIGLGGVSM